jgi:serine/threonine protein kinase
MVANRGELERKTDDDGEWSVVHRIVYRFEQAVRRGERPTIEGALAAAGVHRARALVELVHSDLDYRLKAGEPARVEDYLRNFPELNLDRRTLVDLIAAEWTIRRRTEPTLNGDEYRGRFPGLHAALLDAMSHGSTGLRATLPLVGQAAAEAFDEPELPLPATFHRFELRELVGRGTFGRVYRAWDTVMRQQVAVKLPRRGRSASQADVQTFLREARNASGLRHTNIVQMLEAARHDGTAYMVTEFVEGATLAEILRRGLPTPAASAELMMVVLEAVHYAHEHEKRVIHRDLKPSNILIDARGRPHVTDFGLAQREGGDGSTVQMADSLLVGTLAYMSPEQALGRPGRVDARSDVFSAGVILYELLTGELPFRGRGRMLQAQIVEADPTPPRGLNDAIPRPLEEICLKALAKAPTDRYPTAQAMADNLRSYLDGRAVAKDPDPSPLRRAWRAIAAHPWKTIALAYAVLAAVALPIMGLSLVQSRHCADRLRRENQTLRSQATDPLAPHPTAAP